MVVPFRSARQEASATWSRIAAEEKRTLVLAALDQAFNAARVQPTWLRPRGGLGPIVEAEPAWQRRSRRVSAEAEAARRTSTAGSVTQARRTPFQSARSRAGSRWADLSSAVKRVRVLKAMVSTDTARRTLRRRSGLEQPAHSEERPSTAPSAGASAAARLVNHLRVTPYQAAVAAAGNSWELLTSREQRDCVSLAALRAFGSAITAEPGAPQRTWLRARCGMESPDRPDSVALAPSSKDEAESAAATARASQRRGGGAARARIASRKREKAAEMADALRYAEARERARDRTARRKAYRVPSATRDECTVDSAVARLTSALNTLSAPPSSLATQATKPSPGTTGSSGCERHARALLRWVATGGEVPLHARAALLSEKHNGFMTHWRHKAGALAGGFLTTKKSFHGAPYSAFTLLGEREPNAVAMKRLSAVENAPPAIRAIPFVARSTSAAKVVREKRMQPPSDVPPRNCRPEWMDWVDTTSDAVARVKAAHAARPPPKWLDSDSDEEAATARAGDDNDLQLRVAKINDVHRIFGVVSVKQVVAVLLVAERDVLALQARDTARRAARVASAAAVESNTWARLAAQSADGYQ